MAILGLVVAVSCSLLFGLRQTDAADDTFDYSNSAIWNETYPSCGQSHQSPVELTVTLARPLANLTRPMFLPSTVGTQTWTLEANGRNLNLVIDGSDSVFEMTLEPNSTRVYRLHSIHLHWGDSANIGSEHTLKNVSMPLEMHLVHYDKSYGSLDSAGKSTADASSLAVLGLFGQQQTGDWISNDSKDSLLGRMVPESDELNEIGHSAQRPAFNVYELIANETARSAFFRYDGSLTTPPCSENVIWTVFTNPLLISTDRLQTIRSIPLTNGARSNFRPVQPLNDRNLYVFSA